MAWKHGKPADKAPLDTPLLIASVYEGRRYYKIAKRLRGAWDGQYDPPRETFFWLTLPGHVQVDDVTLYWELPGE
jgi:hypothetical protein